ncbi:metallophosphoesterase [bacterium]|nr:metallophosphoesterase [bacterium]
MMRTITQNIKCLLFICLTFYLAGPLSYAGILNDSRQLPASDHKFNFAIIGDRTGAGPDSWKILDRAIAEVNRLKPDFAIMIGDAIEGSPKPGQIHFQWNEVFSHLDSLKIPLFLVPGNHDIYNRASYETWKKIIGDTYYSFSYHGCRFVIINTEEAHGIGETGLGTQQYNFLKNEIQNHTYDHLFLFMHQPIWMMKSKLGRQWNELEKLFGKRQYTVIAGHLHVLASKREKGALMLIHGPTGGKMRMQRNPALGFFHHFTWVTVNEGNASVAFIEPGRIYGEATALQAYQRYVQSLMLMNGGQ